jgi:hypothetical protein
MEECLYVNEGTENTTDNEKQTIVFRGTPGSGIKQAREILYGDETEGLRPTDGLNCGKLSKMIRYMLTSSFSLTICVNFVDLLANKA